MASGSDTEFEEWGSNHVAQIRNIALRPLEILAYRKSGPNSDYLVRWSDSIVPKELFMENATLLPQIFRLRPANTQDPFRRPARNFEPISSFYVVKWKHSWKRGFEIFEFGALLHAFWSSPYGNSQ
ncbi:hypothetical protein CC78DRAFT_586288 [Lojkania enalia]|uniref:Chromo domain-containing protein n=1 Tax=Lojkania enalia TaxID=147567 RepID=A0A9P4K463_9PLEO|nr:hypothetical protein CC78DRAFT_586288 [Didymosphaeria enalia]